MVSTRPGKPGNHGKLREFDQTPGNHGKVREIENVHMEFYVSQCTR